MFDELKGKMLFGVEMPHDEMLRFHTVEGDYIYQADADCCSVSWVESISEDQRPIMGAIVQDIRTKSQTFDGTRQEVDAVDFVTFVTDKGYFDIEFRNSSNGYYGGSMYLTSRPGDKEVSMTHCS